MLHKRFVPNLKKIEIEITTWCNLMCTNCDRSVKQSPSWERMTAEQIQKFVDESIWLKREWEYIWLIGGEPTLHPDLDSIFEILKTYKTQYPYCVIEVVTNGYWDLVKNKIEKLPHRVQVDFDNLIPFLYSLIIHKLIIDKEKWEVSLAMDFKYFPKYDLLPVSKKLLPKQELNQFPCDEESRMKRIQLIKERYPYTDYLKIALIGDDDLISKLLLPERWLHVSIIEKDMEVIQCIPQNSNCSIIEYDITSLDINKLSNYSVATFLTDPPYTLHGILAFIYTGLSILDIDWSTREFYVIINPTILWKKDLLEIQKKLSSIGIWIEEIHVWFSNYELPLHFSETTRKDIFLEKIKASQKIIRYSSSSNLYIMRTIQPDIIKLKNLIDVSKIYSHF